MSALRRYWRFVLFFALLIIVTAGVAVTGLKFAPALLIGFDVAAVVFMASIIVSLGNDTADEMRERAAANEPDQHILQIVAATVLGVVAVGIGFEVVADEDWALALASATLFMAWLFGNTLFALHYAHAFYVGHEGGGDCAGLAFPGDEKQPGYWDFAYFSFVIGTAFAVSDIRVESKALRRVVLFHSAIAFWFNIGVVALTISLVSAAIA